MKRRVERSGVSVFTYNYTRMGKKRCWNNENNVRESSISWSADHELCILISTQFCISDYIRSYIALVFVSFPFFHCVNKFYRELYIIIAIVVPSLPLLSRTALSTRQDQNYMYKIKDDTRGMIISEVII